MNKKELREFLKRKLKEIEERDAKEVEPEFVTYNSKGVDVSF